MESLTPNIFVKDMKETISFYQDIGFKTVMSVPEKGDFVWVMMNCENVNLMFQTFDSLGADLPLISRQDGGSLLLYIRTKNIRELYEKVKNKVAIIKGLEKTFYGATEFSVLDNNRYILTFAENENDNSENNL